MIIENHHFELEMEVRDYECDLQGIVNNSVYLNYFEHCRHQFSSQAGLDFAKMHNEEGIDPVAIRVEVDYKFPLKPGDKFLVRLRMSKKGRLRMIFRQQIIRIPDHKLMSNARTTLVLTKNGKPLPFDILDKKIREAGFIVEES